jgi:hypothetical protein
MSLRRFSAAAAEGVVLPIVDVTHQDFAITIRDADLAVMCHRFVAESTSHQDVSPAVQGALQRSTLGRALMAASGSFLGGMATYLLKLGPDNLGDWATPIDRRIAASFPAFTTRLRLQDMVSLTAAALTAVGGTHRRDFSCINIAGGTAADSWNTLLYLKAQHPTLLDGRRITISVLDLDPDASSFGKAALEALRTTGAPLETLDVSLHHVDHNWTHLEGLAGLLGAAHASGAVCAISSEGGLFEYGTDAEIVSNLECVQREGPADAFVVGSVTRDGDATRAARMGVGAATRPRTLAQFRSLCDRAGWRLERVVERPFSYNVLLMRRDSAVVAGG